MMAIGASLQKCKVIHVQDMTDYKLLNDLSKSSKEQYRLEMSVFDLTSNPENMVRPVSQAHLITACFLFNEIINSNKKGFVKIIQTLIANMKDGSLLLVIDSAGSFSEATVGGNVHMLFKFLDNLKSFKILEQSDSRWFRFAKGLT